MSFKRFRKMKKCGMACLLAISLTGTSIVPYAGFPVRVEAAVKLSVMETNGDLENASVIWNKTDAEGYNVYYKGTSDQLFVQVDDALIRQYGTTYRVDIPGLCAGEYLVSVVPVKNQTPDFDAAAVKKIQVKAHTREGFCFAPSSPTKGVVSGGYKSDGTPQEGAQILYVNKENVNQVTLDVITSSKGTTTKTTGLANILAARKKGYDTTPLIIRVVGTLSKADVDGLNSNGYLEVKGVKNVTLEGIGTDATLYEIGVLVRDCSNVEVRNLALMKFPDDGVSLDTNNQNIWVHNNDFFYGSAGSDSDQVKGDGSCDIKGKSTYVTISYNHFWDSGKSSLCGMNDTEEFFVTYHHNWFDHSDSRHARIRVGSIHLYNNYFDGNAKYGVGVTKGASAFVEKNVFRNCKYPMLSSQQGTDIADGSEGTFSNENGGIIKAFDNEITGVKKIVYSKEDATQFDAYLASSQNEKVPDTVKTVQGATTYNNFDTDSSKFYSYTPTETSKVKEEVMTYAGRVQGGDFKWTFSDNDDTDYGVNQELMNAVNSYQSKLTKVGGSGVQAAYNGTDESEGSEPTTPTQPSENVQPTTPQQPSDSNESTDSILNDTDSIESQMEIGTMGISGGGFVSGIVTGKNVMYARTDVGGAYKYNYDTNRWEQLFGFLSDADRGLLSVDAMCIDPNDDNTAYFLCGCAYFSDAKTAIMRTRDGGKTFDEINVTDLIQVHGNGQGRQFGEAIAVDPDDSNILYCGGDTGGLIKSTDGGDTWKMVEGYSKLGLFKEEIKWPTWTDHIVKTTDKEYYTCNGIGNVAIADGKVYVGTSITGEANLHVADIAKDEFKPLSSELPTDLLPSHINKDCDGNLLISYVKGIAFDGSKGAGYRYNVKTGELTDISPTSNKGDKPGTGSIVSDPTDPNKLVATSCGLWWGQMWEEGAWEKNKVCYGDITFRSDDGGKTWRQMLPGECSGWGDASTLMTDYLQDNGRGWIRDKAVHWSGSIVLDPKNPSRFLVTSGNGVFACDDVWADIPSIHFQADGIEEVVSLDATCTPDGTFYSVIGDYDGFKHTSTTESTQFSPTMDQNKQAQNASVGAIAYCPTNPNIMVRYSESSSAAYYSKDAGDTWTELPSSVSGGKAAIAQLGDNSYRIFRTGSGTVSYTDDFGASWNQSTGTEGSSTLWACVDEKNPKYVYAYGYYYNQYYNGSSQGKDPTIDDARYTLMVSSDYGKTFEKQTICLYDRCDSAYRIAYLDEGKFVLAAGYQGAYLVTECGKKVTKLDSIPYCKTIGYGAPKNAGGPNTLFAWGKPQGRDTEGIYCSTDEGKTWIAVDTKKTYGGTGNGNYIVGDKKNFGTFYMSTVGCGIVYGKLKSGGAGSSEPTNPQDVAVEKIQLKESQLTVKVGEEETLNYTITPANATNRKVTWKSDHPEIAAVENGKIIALKEGKAVITVTTEDGKKTSKCTVTVEKAENTGSEEPSMESGTENPSTQKPSETQPSANQPSESGSGFDQPSDIESGSNQPDTGSGSNRPSDAGSGWERPSNGGAGSEKPSTQYPGSQNPQEPSKVEVETVKITEQNVSMEIGETKQFHTEIFPETASDQTVTWTSAQPQIASVSSDGTVTALKDGVAVICVRTANGKEATTSVTVKKAGESGEKIPSIQMKTACALHVGEQETLNVVLQNADSKDLNWMSSDPEIASVTNGTITAKKAGTTIVIAYIGSVKAICRVTVTEKPTLTEPVTDVQFQTTTVLMTEGEKQQLTWQVLPDNATNKNVTFMTSDPDIVWIDEEGCLTAFSAGSAYVFVTTEDGSKTAKCQVTVQKREESTNTVDVKDVTLNCSNEKLEVGDTLQLIPTISPENATNRKVRYETSNPNVATVEADGMVTVWKAGTAIITVVTESQNKSAQCFLQVTESSADETEDKVVKPTSIKLSVSGMTLKVGQKKTLKASVWPENATEKKMTFSSNNSAVKVLSQNGTSASLQAKKPGIAVITIRAKGNTNVTKKVTIQVKPQTVTSLKGKQTKASAVKLTWKQLSGVSGYQLYWYDAKKKKYRLKKTTGSTSCTIGGLKKGKTYKFKVRAYKKSGSKVLYGDYSKIVSVKIKK
ncbi:MAG: Ig-like domain-containing protein [Lachnospiraceae bacterium]